MTGTHPSTERMHALDGLRATMMLLGLVLHAIVSYVTFETTAWPYQDPNQSYPAEIVFQFIHVFRMPIFFVIAGLFSAMLYERRGVKGLAKNRFSRIAIPFGVGLLVLWPVIRSAANFANTAATTSPANAILSYNFDFSLLPETTMHLWFLYFLLWFYLGGITLALVCERLPHSVRTTFSSSFRAIAARPLLRILVLTGITTGMLSQSDGKLITSVAFMPDARILLHYFIFFGFGWLLYHQKDLLAHFPRFAWTQTFAGTAIFLIVALGFLPQNYTEAGTTAQIIARALMNSAVVWLLFFGFTGLFLRYLDRPSPRIRYIVDGSYWVYLIHLPFCAWIPGLLVDTGLPALVKILITLTATTIITFATYNLFVRSTFIGKVLNGRRYPRGLPPAPGELSAAKVG